MQHDLVRLPPAPAMHEETPALDVTQLIIATHQSRANQLLHYMTDETCPRQTPAKADDHPAQALREHFRKISPFLT